MPRSNFCIVGSVWRCRLPIGLPGVVRALPGAPRFAVPLRGGPPGGLRVGQRRMHVRPRLRRRRLQQLLSRLLPAGNALPRQTRRCALIRTCTDANPIFNLSLP